MTKRPGGKARADDQGLRRYAESAPTAVMRELAAAASWRGFTLGAIARRINKSAGGVDPSNVRRYFESKAPRSETIALLRDIIGLKARHVQLASGERLSDRDYRQTESALRTELAANEARFAEGAVDEALSAFERLDQELRFAVLGVYELQRQRNDALMVGARTVDFPHLQFAEALRHYTGFDLLARLREPSANEEALWNLWITLAIPPTGAFTERESEMIVSHASALLRARGVDTRPMEERVQRERSALSRAKLAAKRLEEES